MADEPVSFWRRVVSHQSALVLVLANLVPIWGVLYLRWSIFPVVFLFWMENVIIGFFNVLKMLIVGAIGGQREESFGIVIRCVWRVFRIAGALFVCMFFAVHYGMFCFVHGMFVVSFLGDEIQSGGPVTMLLTNVMNAFAGELGIAAAVLFFSHAFSFVFNFLVRREYMKVGVGDLMGSPYGRVIVLHVAILFGAFISIASKSNFGVLILLVVMKIILDLKFHLKERESGAVSLLKPRTRTL